MMHLDETLAKSYWVAGREVELAHLAEDSPVVRPSEVFLLAVDQLPAAFTDLPPCMTPVFKLGFCPPTDQPCVVAEAQP